MKKIPAFLNQQERDESGWISIADLMSGLAVLFLLIVVSHKFENESEKEERVRLSIAQEQKDREDKIRQFWKDKFNDKLEGWYAEIDKKKLTIRFSPPPPTVLFDWNSDKLKDDFEDILDEFCPIFIVSLKDNFSDDIEEVRIEGHTSSYSQKPTGIENYIGNMKLSQGRARNVLEYCLGQEEVEQVWDWVVEKVTANGLSFSRLICEKAGAENEKKSRGSSFGHLICDEGSRENREKSRRVEFTVKVKKNILKEASQDDSLP